MPDRKQEMLMMLPAKQIRMILDVIAGLQARAKAGERVTVPLVTVTMKSGNEFSGLLLDIKEDRQKSMALFQIYTGERLDPTYKVIYVETERIESLTVHSAPDFAYALSMGEADLSAYEPPPTRLSLQRKAHDCVKSFGISSGINVNFSIAWDTIPDKEETMRKLSFVIEELCGAFLEITKDSFAKELLSNHLKNIILTSGSPPDAVMESDTLTVKLDFQGSPKEKMSRKSLINLIEKAF